MIIFSHLRFDWIFLFEYICFCLSKLLLKINFFSFYFRVKFLLFLILFSNIVILKLMELSIFFFICIIYFNKKKYTVFFHWLVRLMLSKIIYTVFVLYFKCFQMLRFTLLEGAPFLLCLMWGVKLAEVGESLS